MDSHQSTRSWRLRMLLALGMGEMTFSSSRRALSLATPNMIADGLTTKDVGTIASSFSCVYALSKFGAAIATDRFSCRMLFCVGLLGAGVANLMFSVAPISSSAQMCAYWALNGFFQGGGWPAAAKLIMAWYPDAIRGTYWSLIASGTNVGNGLSPLMLSRVIELYGWRASFQASGVVAMGASALLMMAIRDSPSDVGLDVSLQEGTDQTHQTTKGHKGAVTASACDLLLNKTLWVLSFTAGLLCFVINGISNWGMLYLMETQHASSFRAASCLFWLDAGGLAGAVSSGPVADVVCRKGACSRGSVAQMYSMIAVFSVVLLWRVSSMQAHHWGYTSCAFFILGMFLYSPKVIVGLLVRESLPRKLAGSAGGMLELMSEIGTACAGLPLGAALHHFGWICFFKALLGGTMLVVVVLGCGVPGKQAGQATSAQRLVKDF